MSSPPLPPFDCALGSKYTLPPNPSWSWRQPIGSTSDGRTWMQGEEQGWKTIVTAKEDPNTLYAIMISGVVPRPIALVSTISDEGVENLAPFRYDLTAITPVSTWLIEGGETAGLECNHPPIVAISCLDLNNGLKHTTENILQGESGFVINIISEPFVEQANATAIDCPRDVDEWGLSGLSKLPSTYVEASRVKESAFSMECRLYQSVPIISEGVRTTTLLLAHVQCIHVRNDVLTERGTVDITKFKPVARMGDNSYARVGDAYKLTRPSWARDEEAVRHALTR